MMALLWAIVIVLATGTGCAEPTASAGTPDHPHLITLAGAGPQGRYFKEVSLMSKMLTDKMPGVIANGVIGKGMSVGNLKRVAAGKIDGGRFFRFDLENAYGGSLQFAQADGQQEKRPLDYGKVQVWMRLNTQLFRVIAVTGIESYADLRGRTVVIGGKGTGEETLAEQILGHYGVTRDNTNFLYIERTDGQQALANRQVDAIAFAYSRNNRGHLSPVFAARTQGEQVDFVEPEPEGTTRLLAAEPAFFLDTRGEPVFNRPELRGIAFHTGLAIRAGLPESLVYDMTRTLFDNWDEIEKSLPWWKEPGEGDLASAAAMKPLPYHPGAVRYYRELGVWE